MPLDLGEQEILFNRWWDDYGSDIYNDQPAEDSMFKAYMNGVHDERNSEPE